MPLIKGKSPASFGKNVSTEMHEGKPLKQSLAIAYAMKKKAKKMAQGGDMDSYSEKSQPSSTPSPQPPSPQPSPNPTAESLKDAFGAGHRWFNAKGGEICAAHGAQMCGMCHGGKMAEGGDLAANSRFWNEKGIHQPTLPGEGTSMAGRKSREGDSFGSTVRHNKVLDQHEALRKKDRRNLAEGGFVHEEEESGYEPMEDDDDMVSRIMKKRSSIHSGNMANETGEDADVEPNQFDYLTEMDDSGPHYTGENSGDEIGDEQEDEDRRDIVSRIMRSRRLKDHNPRPA